jgi:hypothetical protein
MISPEIFYLHIHGEQRGPYTIPQIDHLLNSGLIAEETLYWREGLDQWQPVTTLVTLRKKGKRWIKPLIALGVLLVLTAIGQFFGSVALLGWREANQHDYTEKAAYWRARGVVRNGTLAPGTVVEFGRFETARVEMHPPTGASVRLPGEVTEPDGKSRDVTWSVPMTFDAQGREWTGGAVQEEGR